MGMDLPKDKIDSYNKIFREKFGRDATEEEIYEIDRDIRRLVEIIYESYIHFKKSGKLAGIMKEIESEKLKNNKK